MKDYNVFLLFLWMGIFFPLSEHDPKCEMIISKLYVFLSACLLSYYFITKKLNK